MDHVGSRHELYEQWEEQSRLAAEYALAKSAARSVRTPVPRGISLKLTGKFEMYRFKLSESWREALFALLRATGHDAGIEDDSRVACRLDMAIGTRLEGLVRAGVWAPIRELLMAGATEH